MSRKSVIILLIITAAATIFVTLTYQPVQAPTNELVNANPISNILNTNFKNQPRPTVLGGPEQYEGIITLTNESNYLYLNPKYGLSFTYPLGWYVGDNHLGYGTFQIFNYPPGSIYSGYVQPKDSAKIEIAIASKNSFEPSHEYPEISRRSSTVEVAGEQATRYQVKLLEGDELVSYFIPFPNSTTAFLIVSAYGDPTSFSVLDNLVKTVSWKRR